MIKKVLTTIKHVVSNIVSFIKKNFKHNDVVARNEYADDSLRNMWDSSYEPPFKISQEIVFDF